MIYTSVNEIFPGETPFNRAISQAYEPGSVVKILTMSAALDTGTVTPGHDLPRYRHHSLSAAFPSTTGTAAPGDTRT